MSAILQLVLENQVTPDQLLSWLKIHSDSGQQIPLLQEYARIKREFVPFFINYLRDQSSHLFQGCRSTNPSPVKTPLGLKFPRQHSKSETSTPLSSSSNSTAKLAQLFGVSPLDSTPQLNKNQKKRHESGNTSLENTFSCPARGISSRKSKDHQKSTNVNNNYRNPGWKSSQNHAGSSESSKTRSRHCLGDFFATPDSESPIIGGSQDESISTSGRRPTGKNQKGSNNKRARKIQLTRVSSPQAPSAVFSLGNFEEFPPMGSTAKKTSDITIITPSRRITPTTVTTKQNETTSGQFKQSGNAIVGTQAQPAKHNKVFTNAPTEDISDLDIERKLLREAKAKQADEKTPKKSAVVVLTITPTKASLDRLLSTTERVKADRMEVTNDDKLEMLASVYCGLMFDALVPNVTVELYFVIQLLTAKGNEEVFPQFLSHEVEDMNYFNSIHNAVYFATLVLEQQVKLLSYLDKGTLRLLIDNQRVAEFSLSFQAKLKELHNNHPASKTVINPPSPLGGVSFQADTDNRKNFMSDKSFHIFKKQRDLFYELIREWEDNHQNPGWSMVLSQTQSIQNLLGMSKELDNHIHFARLFQSQLLQMCKGDNSIKSEGDEEKTALLSELKQTNPDKFKKLQERFITPSTVGGPCPAPTFPGSQEFFRDFIHIGSSHLFNQHLMTSMGSKVTELNRMSFMVVEAQAESDKVVVDHEDREALTGCLLTLRLLGKFLGYLTFMPYYTLQRLPNDLQSSCVTMRNQGMQPLDLQVFLKNAVTEGRLVVTVPWVVEYLSMIDSMALQVEYFQMIYSTLVQIYRIVGKKFNQEGSHSYLLVILILGWLFEVPNFAAETFFSEDCQDLALPSNSFDELGIVDQTILYTCCPYLGEIRNLLMNFAVGSSSKNSNIRKITPISTEQEPAQMLTDRQIQHQLEENFFHNHPASLKRTVEFVADRVASNYIKRYRSTTLAAMLVDGIKQTKDLAKRLVDEAWEKNLPKVKNSSKKFDVLCNELKTKAKDEETQDVESYCVTNCSTILPLLLPEEIAPQVVLCSSKISCRQAGDKIKQWVNVYVTKDMFRRELGPEYEKQLKSKMKRLEKSLADGKPVVLSDKGTEPDTDISRNESLLHLDDGTEPVHNENSRSPSDIVSQLKDILEDLTLRDMEVTHEDLTQFLQEVTDMFKTRQDIFSSVPRTLGKTTVDLTYILICQHRELWTHEVQECLFNLWMTYLMKHSRLDSIICMKHVAMLEASSDKQTSWKEYQDLMKQCLSKKLLKPIALKNGFCKVHQTVQERDTLVQLARCVTNSIQDTVANLNIEETRSDIEDLLDWLFQKFGKEIDIKENIEGCLKELNNAGVPQETGQQPSMNQVTNNLETKENCEPDNPLQALVTNTKRTLGALQVSKTERHDVVIKLITDKENDTK